MKICSSWKWSILYNNSREEAAAIAGKVTAMCLSNFNKGVKNLNLTKTSLIHHSLSTTQTVPIPPVDKKFLQSQRSEMILAIQLYFL